MKRTLQTAPVGVAVWPEQTNFAPNFSATYRIASTKVNWRAEASWTREGSQILFLVSHGSPSHWFRIR